MYLLGVHFSKFGLSPLCCSSARVTRSKTAETSNLAVQPLDLGLSLAVAFNHGQVEMQLANLLVDSLKAVL